MKRHVESLRAVCVFCASRRGRDSLHVDAARGFGRLLAERDLTLIYGGGGVGLMGELADACLQAGGRVVGVIPRMLLDREAGHSGLSDLQIVSTLSERKKRMSDLADAFVVLPGGIGTLDELFEVWTWSQLKIEHKPCAMLNTGGYYDALLQFLDQTVAHGFLSAEHRRSLIVDQDAARLLDAVAAQVRREVPARG
jgi:uncharacterized protein (TIGR00730 family)